MSRAGTPTASAASVPMAANDASYSRKLGARVPQDVRRLLGVEQRRDGHDHRAGREDAVVGADEVHDVRGEQRDPVTGPDPLPLQGGGVLPGLPPQVAVPDPQVALDDREPVRGTTGGLGQHAGEGEQRHACSTFPNTAQVSETASRAAAEAGPMSKKPWIIPSKRRASTRLPAAASAAA